MLILLVLDCQIKKGLNFPVIFIRQRGQFLGWVSLTIFSAQGSQNPWPHGISKCGILSAPRHILEKIDI